MFNEDLLSKFRELHLDSNRYVIFGSGPLGIRGIRESADLDAVVTDDYYKELLIRFPGRELKPGVIVVDKDIEICCNYSGVADFLDDVIREGEIIQGIKFMPLKYLMKWKENYGREKDLRDIELIKNYLANGGK